MTRNAPPSESLAARIDDAERRLRVRQRSVGMHGTMLRRRIHERMTSPALLGSAVGLGFLLGNRTRGPGSGPSWLRTAVSSIAWMHTLFATVHPSAPTGVSSSSEFSDQQ
jgi:H+/Cl- antiporter ClcA